MIFGFNVANFLLGSIGALVIVYLFKNTAIPEFPAVDDVKDASDEILRIRDRLDKRQVEIDAIQEQLRTDLSNAASLTLVLRSIKSIITADLARLALLERRIQLSRVFSRGLGFAVFILLGGVVASLLTGRLKVSAAGADGVTLPEIFQAMLIGATWTSFLSMLGFHSTQNAAADAIDDAKGHIGQQVDALEQKVLEHLQLSPAGQGLAHAPVPAVVADSISQDFDCVRQSVKNRLEASKRDVRGASRRIF